MAKEWDRTEFEALLLEAKQKGYTKKELAELLGVPASTISEWVKGNHAPHALFQAKFSELRRKLKDRKKEPKKPKA